MGVFQVFTASSYAHLESLGLLHFIKPFCVPFFPLHHRLEFLLTGQTPPSSYEKFYCSFRKLHEDFINVTFSAKPQYERLWFNCAYFIDSLDSSCSAPNVYFFHSAQTKVFSSHLLFVSYCKIWLDEPCSQSLENSHEEQTCDSTWF